MRKLFCLTVLLLAALVLSACNPSTPDIPPTFIQGAGYTIGAATYVAKLTQTAQPLELSLKTITPEVTQTPDTPSPNETGVQVELTHTPTGSPPAVRPTSSFVAPSPIYSTPGTLDVAYTDDFEVERGWAEFQTSGYEVGYSFGHYRFYVGIVTGNTPIFSIRQQEYRDASIKVDIVRREGPENGYFGVLCRFIDSDNYYRFVFSPDGSYSIGAKVKGDFSVLAEGSEEKLYLDDKDNSLRADCLGNSLALYVNDKLLVSTTDDTLQSGFVGLVAGTSDAKGLIVYFDSFVLSKP